MNRGAGSSSGSGGQAAAAAASAEVCQGHGTASVRVVCRVRPMDDREKKAGTVPAVTASTENRDVAVVRKVGAGAARPVRSTFRFDEVLTSFSSQADVFNATLRPLVDEVLLGFDATAFAYGQTGTGKTHTMEGDLGSEEGRGLVPRVAQAMVEALSTDAFSEYSLHVSYLEIYNEELSDLLKSGERRLELKEAAGEVRCVGLSEVPVASAEEILELVRAAQDRRRVAETRINARSSRSHCIFTLKVRCRRRVLAGEVAGELENSGRLHLVDLAGSECAGKASSAEKTGAKATEEERERRNINQSLLTLGRVIAALRSGSSRVPYRDSKLTRLLQDALGGRCKTVLIATISPSLAAAEETISTLSYAEQAAGIKNRPVANSLYKSVGRQGFVAVPHGELVGGVSACDWSELEMRITYLNQEVEEAQSALARKYRETLELSEQLEAARGELDAHVAQLEQMRQRLAEKTFVQECTAQDADKLFAAKAQLLAAHAAACEHGGKLGQQLLDAHSSALAMRGQARKACTSTEERFQSIAAHHAEGVQHIGEAVRSMRESHCAASQAHCEDLEKQSSIMHELVSEVQASCSTADSCLAAALQNGLECSCEMASGEGHSVVMQELRSAASEGHANQQDVKALAEHAASFASSAAERRRSLQGRVDSTQEKQQLALSSHPANVRASMAALEEHVLQHSGAAASTCVAAKAALVSEVEQLRAQRAHENELVSMLTGRRKSLQAELDLLGDDLAKSRAELRSTQAKCSQLRDSQSQKRDRLLQVVSDALNGVRGALCEELGGLATELEDDAACVSSHLQVLETLATSTEATTLRTKSQCVEACDEAVGVVNKWGQDVESRCQGLAVPAEKLDEASSKISSLRECFPRDLEDVAKNVCNWEASDRSIHQGLQEIAKVSSDIEENDRRGEGQTRLALASLDKRGAEISCLVSKVDAHAAALVGTVQKHRTALTELGKVAGQARSRAADFAKSGNVRAQQELQRGGTAEALARGKLHALAGDNTSSLEEQKASLRALLGAAPLSAFAEAPPVPPVALPEAAKVPEQGLLQRRPEKQLLADFKALHDQENKDPAQAYHKDEVRGRTLPSPTASKWPALPTEKLADACNECEELLVTASTTPSGGPASGRAAPSPRVINKLPSPGWASAGHVGRRSASRNREALLEIASCEQPSDAAPPAGHAAPARSC